MILTPKMKHNVFLAYLSLMFLLAFEHQVFSQIKKTTSKKSTKKEELQLPILNLRIIPRIKMIEKNSLKSYIWWTSGQIDQSETSGLLSRSDQSETSGLLSRSDQSGTGINPVIQNDSTLSKTENDKPLDVVSIDLGDSFRKIKTPKIFQDVLKKMKVDFFSENINLDFFLTPISAENISSYEDYFVLTGNLVLDSKNKKTVELNELSFYQIKNSKLNLLFISQITNFTAHSSFQGLAKELNDQLSNKIYSTKTNSDSYYTVVFESELEFEELKSIQLNLKKALSLDLNQVQLFASEKNRYTFNVFTNSDPFDKIKNLTFVNGPYKHEVSDKTIVFKNFSEQEVLEP